MSTFTTDDLLQFLYNESAPKKTSSLKIELAANWALNEKFQVLESAKQLLNKINVFSPRAKAVDNIIAYAQRSSNKISAEV